MINTTKELIRAGISTTSAVRAINDVRNMIEASGDAVAAASNFIAKIIDRKITFSNQHVALLTAQAMVEIVVKAGCMIESCDDVLLAAVHRSDAMFKRDDLQFAFVAEESEDAPRASGMQEAVAAQSTKELPPVNASRAGSKRERALAMYKAVVIDAETPATPADIRAMFQEQLDMTVLGARTYLTMCRQYFV